MPNNAWNADLTSLIRVIERFTELNEVAVRGLAATFYKEFGKPVMSGCSLDSLIKALEVVNDQLRSATTPTSTVLRTHHKQPSGRNSDAAPAA